MASVMSFFDEYLTTHASELLRLELWFALMVIAVGCGIALHGAVHAREPETALIGETKPSSSSSSSSTAAESIFTTGKIPYVMDLSDRFGECRVHVVWGRAMLIVCAGDLCNFRIFTKVRESYQN